MNAAPLPDNADDDEIESAAEELLGVDFSSTEDLTGLDEDNDDLFGDDFDVDLDEPVSEESADEDDLEPVEAEADTDTPFDDEFGGGLDEFAESEPEPAAPSKPDNYWDALEGWDWDEGAGRAEPEAETPGREAAPARPEENREAFQRPAPKKLDAFLDDDEFGAGLLEDPSRASHHGSAERRPPPERRPPAAAPERPRRQPRDATGPDKQENERRPGREGGRRRGRDSGERRDEGRHRRGERREAPPRSEPPAEAAPPVSDLADNDSDFGSGLDEVSETTPAVQETPEREQRRGRRRRGRGRDRARAEQQPQPTQPPREEPVLQEEPEEPGFEFDADEEDDRVGSPEPVSEGESEPVEVEPDARYQGVPTWEEAISYLVNPKARSGSRPSEGSSRPAEGTSRGGSRRSSGEGERGRRRGGSRRGGRGRGRRPPSSSGGGES